MNSPPSPQAGHEYMFGGSENSGNSIMINIYSTISMDKPNMLRYVIVGTYAGLFSICVLLGKTLSVTSQIN